MDVGSTPASRERRSIPEAARGPRTGREAISPVGSAGHRLFARPITPPRWLRYVVFAASLIPFVFVVVAIASDYFNNTRFLGSNPIKEAEHFTGKWTLRFLILSLSVTPAVKLLRQGWLIPYRRTFGLFAFFYACTHLTIYAVLDVELTWSDMVADVLDRVYITIGMTALLLLTPLAITSTKGWIRRLGNRRWKALHRLVYVVAVLGNIHYWMSVKRDVREPIIFSALFLVLLGWRIWWSRREASRRTTNAIPAA
jgi:methionine sulfoxide reductase heme-binding subunit